MIDACGQEDRDFGRLHSVAMFLHAHVHTHSHTHGASEWSFLHFKIGHRRRDRVEAYKILCPFPMTSETLALNDHFLEGTFVLWAEQAGKPQRALCLPRPRIPVSSLPASVRLTRSLSEVSDGFCSHCGHSADDLASRWSWRPSARCLPVASRCDLGRVKWYLYTLKSLSLMEMTSGF